jgi:DNA-binding phage protein
MPTIVITPHRIQAHLDAILEFEDTPEMLVAVLSSVAPLASIMADGERH